MRGVMSHKLSKYFLSMALAGSAVPAAPVDEIKVAHPRPMMILSSELAARYGYLVTYEDAPADPVREILVETRANGRQIRTLGVDTDHLPCRRLAPRCPAERAPVISRCEACAARAHAGREA
jgi:hypothetical protein